MMSRTPSTLVTTAALGLFLSTAVHPATLAETKLCYMLGDLGTSITTARDLGAPIEQARAIALATRTGGGPALDAEWQLYGLRNPGSKLFATVWRLPAREACPGETEQTVLTSHAGCWLSLAPLEHMVWQNLLSISPLTLLR